MMQAAVCSRIRILSIAILAWLCAHGVAVPQDVVLQPLSSWMPEQLRAGIEAAGHPPRMTIQREAIHALDSLVRFYERRVFRPVWICDDGLQPHAEALVQVISQAEREGMRSASYHLSRLEKLMAELRQGAAQDLSRNQHAWVDLELLLTDAFFSYGSHVLTGQIDPRELKEAWFGDRPQVDLETVLQQALETNRVVELLHNLRPTHAGYAGLQKALASYRDIAARGGWPVIPDGPKLQRGDRGPRVAALRNRLLLTADLDRASAPVNDVFDAALERGVQRFQERHGIEADGVIGTSTLAALNVPAEARVRQIEFNMERWRWLPQELGDRYILVNIANFALDVVEHGQSVLAMRVVAGKPARRTPFFSAAMTYLVLSPHWYVPPTIAIQDKLPLIRRDPAFVARQNFKIYRDGEGGPTRVDPMSVDWSSVSAHNFPYRLRQDPGPRNALGRVKFMFPNPYNVYLHDTPSRELFAKTERAFSSGCIRLEKPIELAEYLLRDDPRWSRQKILATIEKGAEQVVHLPTSIPVYLFYWTAWVNEDGVVHFRKDIYERDKVLDKVLRETFPSPRGEDKVVMALKHS
jgi:murein L,D-transpeptidase YcbB/YkuD